MTRQRTKKVKVEADPSILSPRILTVCSLDQTLSEKYVLLIANAARAINARVLDISHAPLVLSQYNGSHEEIDDIIKALVDELAKDSIGNDDNAQNICRVMLETLKQVNDV